MPTHDPHHPKNPNDPDERLAHESEEFMRLQQGSDPESRKVGYELADANVKDTAIFLVILGMSVAVVFVLAFGIGKLINMELVRQDGPPNKWAQMSGVKPGNLVSDPRIQQQQLQQMVKRFPTPRLQTDDGNMEVAQMHAREDMLLNHYSWVDEQKQTVRIPITRAMQLLAQRGLPVESDQQAEEKPIFGDGSRAVTAPLTDGFARTGPELQMIEARQQQMEGLAPRNAQAELQSAH
jgi:hypothetical protein